MMVTEKFVLQTVGDAEFLKQTIADMCKKLDAQCYKCPIYNEDLGCPVWDRFGQAPIYWYEAEEVKE